MVSMTMTRAVIAHAALLILISPLPLHSGGSYPRARPVRGPGGYRQ